MSSSFEKPRDVVGGLVIVGIGGLFLLFGRELPVGTSFRMGPGYFPAILSWVMVALGIAVFCSALFIKGLELPLPLTGPWLSTAYWSPGRRRPPRPHPSRPSKEARPWSCSTLWACYVTVMLASSRFFRGRQREEIAGPGGNFFANSRANSSQSSDTLSSSCDCDNLLIKDPHRQRNHSE